MVIDVIVIKTNDGFTAEVPSLKGCETWAHTEDEVIGKIVELTSFYLNLPPDNQINIDKARKQGSKTIYKLIFEKGEL